MRRIVQLIALLLLTTFSNTTNAQVTLPYYSGFDDASQQNGWVEFKKAATQFSHWGYGGAANSYSQPSSIGHDYSPSTNITITDNWYVSPGFTIPSGGHLDSIRYRFTGFSVPGPGDTIAVYLLSGSQDPDLALKIMLVDFRDADYNADGTYRLKTDLVLPGNSGMSYLAIRYLNSDCSSKWLTVGFDNVAISANSTFGLSENEKLSILDLSPNPTNGSIQLTLNSEFVGNDLVILDKQSREVLRKTVNKVQMNLNLSVLPNGVYFLKYADEVKRIVIQK